MKPNKKDSLCGVTLRLAEQVLTLETIVLQANKPRHSKNEMMQAMDKMLEVIQNINTTLKGF